MNWFNPFGLAFIVLLMIPNIVFALKFKEGFSNTWRCMAVEIAEQLGRYACMAFMVFSVPGLTRGFCSNEAFALYLIVDITLLLTYCVLWAVLFRHGGMVRALSLSVIPSLLFLFSGWMYMNIPLIIAALIFSPCHILLSCKNAAADKDGQP